MYNNTEFGVVELSKILLLLFFFGYSSYSDIRYRKVPNGVWYALLPIATVFLSIEYFILKTLSLSVFFLSAIVVILFAYFILYQWCKIGGADVKAIMVLALFFPGFYKNIPITLIIVMLASLLLILYHFVTSDDMFCKSRYPFMVPLTLSILAITICMYT